MGPGSDISTALRLTYTATSGHDAVFTFVTQYGLSEPSGFYLEQSSSTDSVGQDDHFYFSASASDAAVPEPGTWVMFGAGTLALAFAKRRAWRGGLELTFSIDAANERLAGLTRFILSGRRSRVRLRLSQGAWPSRIHFRGELLRPVPFWLLS